MFTFLWINGLALNVAEVEAASVMLQVAASEMDEQALADWLAANTLERVD
jgi:prophage maintenance system killer protein